MQTKGAVCGARILIGERRFRNDTLGRLKSRREFLEGVVESHIDRDALRMLEDVNEEIHIRYRTKQRPADR